jgi:hypothetical protein
MWGSYLTSGIVKALVRKTFWIPSSRIRLISPDLLLLVLTYNFLIAVTTAWLNGDTFAIDIVDIDLLKTL